METQYEIKVWPRTTEEDKKAEVSRIDALFSKIDARYWEWRDGKHEEGIKELTSKNIMSREEAEAFFDNQHEGEIKDLISVFEDLSAHYVRLYPYVQAFNNVGARAAIAEDKGQYKEFCAGLKCAHTIAFGFKPGILKGITIWYSTRKKSALEGINGYILEDIYERLIELPDLFPCSDISEGEEGFDVIRSIIQEETSKHRFEDRYTPKSDLQPLAERCSDLYSDIMKHKDWIFDKNPASNSYSEQAGKMIIKLLGLRFPEVTGFNKEKTFINALHPIRYVEIHSWPTMVDISSEGLI